MSRLSAFTRASRWRPVALAAATLVSLSGLTPARVAEAAGPTFVQQESAHVGGETATSVSVTLRNNVTAGNRLVVVVGVWNTTGPTASAMTDSAGNSYTEVTHQAGPNRIELSVWT